jgi:hypothetical protein
MWISKDTQGPLATGLAAGLGGRQSCLSLFGKQAWHLWLLSYEAQPHTTGQVTGVEPLSGSKSLKGLLSLEGSLLCI